MRGKHWTLDSVRFCLKSDYTISGRSQEPANQGLQPCTGLLWSGLRVTQFTLFKYLKRFQNKTGVEKKKEKKSKKNIFWAQKCYNIQTTVAKLQWHSCTYIVSTSACAVIQSWIIPTEMAWPAKPKKKCLTVPGIKLTY